MTGLAPVVGTVLARAPSMLDTHGPEAHRIAGVWWLMFGLAAGVYVVVATLIVVAILRGRRSESGRRSRISDGAFVWWGGVLGPVAILAVLAVVTVQTTMDVRKPEKGALRVEVVGKRWWWAVSYPGTDVVTANEIHVPVGRPIDMRVDSDNVIHSFWVPQLAGKLDMIPGQHNVLRFTARQAGTYRGQCAEFCGIQHARMVFLVVADPPAVFGRWLARRQRVPSTPVSDLAEQGRLVFERAPCAGCHTIRGTQARGDVGPDLTDFASRRWIGSVTVRNTTANLSGWVLDAQSVKPGNLMPPISLEPAELRAIVAYLESLK